MLRDLRNHLLKGLGLALFVATGFSAWVTFLRVAYGTTAFDRLHTTYGAVVALYYLGGLAAGILLGVFWPLRRWLPGSALLGMLAVFQLYFGAAFTDSPRSCSSLPGPSLLRDRLSPLFRSQFSLSPHPPPTLSRPTPFPAGGLRLSAPRRPPPFGPRAPPRPGGRRRWRGSRAPPSSC